MAGNKVHARIIIGLMLVFFGAIFLLRNYDIFYFPFDIFTWEYFFIFFGIILFGLAKNKTPGVVFIAIGLFNLVPELWPLIIVAIGLFIIFRQRTQSHKNYSALASTTDADDKDLVEEVNIFGGNVKIMNSDNFKGGNVVSLFGGSEVNLSNCKLAQGDNILDVTFIFGGSTLIVPPNWKVELDVIAIFGGFGDKRRKDPNMVYEDGKKLIVKGLVLFGGGEIKN